MRCIFIYGPPASGKLTVATALRDLTGLPLFHNHLAVDTALSLFEFGSPSFVRLRDIIWRSAFMEAARADRSFIFTFNPEASVPAAFVETVNTIVESAGGRIVFVSLTCSEAVIESRLSADSRKEFGKLTSLEQYRQLRADGAFAFAPMPEPDLSIDSGALSAVDAARQIHELLRTF